jgi:hypothetical protein
MRQEAVFNTEAEAETNQVAALASHKAVHNDEPYATQTTKWDIPRNRLDGKWAVDTCEHFDYTGYTVEDYNVSNYEE